MTLSFKYSALEKSASSVSITSYIHNYANVHVKTDTYIVAIRYTYVHTVTDGTSLT